MTPREGRFETWRANPGRETLVALLEASQGRLLRICLTVLADRHEAEEAVQETLLKIMAGLDEVADHEHYERWSGRIAQRTALDRRRSNKRRQVREFTGARREQAPRVSGGLQDALALLAQEDRDLITERYFERRTFEEMGRRRGVSDVAVRKRVS